MRNFKYACFLIFHLFLGGVAMSAVIPQAVQKLIDQGEFAKAREALRDAAEDMALSENDRQDLLWEAERLRRFPLDFDQKPADVLKQIQKDIPGATREDVDAWTKEGALESLVIDGTRYYYRRAVRNLFLINKKAMERRSPKSTERKPPDVTEDGVVTDMRIHAKNALEARKKSSSSRVTPQRFRVDFTLAVKPGEVPKGRTIRCWLPFPKQCPTQTDILINSSVPEKAFTAPNECEQRTVYLELPSRGDEPTTFSLSFEYTAWAFVEPVDPGRIKPYDTNSETYQKYTAEKPPHIVFTPDIRNKAREICGNETNPYLKAKKIFEWVADNIPWSGAIEYCLVRNLSMRTYLRKTGDCGMQGLLFISLCRASGVPARWQSGWSLRPARENMHDWAQIYVEPYGWLYADPSHGFMESEDPEIKWFNFGNFDRYRLIVNSDYGMQLDPPKIHFRSDPVDFQRGEVEWSGGNLYYNQWTYECQMTPIATKE